MELERKYANELFAPPLKRAAYSDRTACLMAIMSKCAYTRFEDPFSQDKLKELAEFIITQNMTESQIVSALSQLRTPEMSEKEQDILKQSLQIVGFELIETFDVKFGSHVDTQAFLTKVRLKAHDQSLDNMIVLAFRGTEPKKIEDIKSDLDAEMISPKRLADDRAKVHNGFYYAFEAAEEKINKALENYSDDPLYITGHSLGGALAVIATRFLKTKSLGACYTFGAPKCCNTAFAQQIFTPIYRVVNESDPVPLFPPSGAFISILCWLLNRAPILSPLAKWLGKMRQYTHHGSQKYLTKPKSDIEDYESDRYDLALKPRRSFIDFMKGFFMHFISVVGDHSIDDYADKLFYYAVYRQRLKAKINARPIITDLDKR